MKSLPHPMLRLVLGIGILYACFLTIKDYPNQNNMNQIPDYFFVLKKIHLNTDGEIVGYSFFHGDDYRKGASLKNIEYAFKEDFLKATSFRDYQTPEYLIKELRSLGTYYSNPFQIEKIYK